MEGGMKSFRYYRYAAPEETTQENKKVLEILKVVCVVVASVFLVAIGMFLLR